MTAFKSYFKAHFKSSLRTLLYILVITLVLTFVIGFNNQVYERQVWDGNDIVSYVSYRSTLYSPVIFLCLLAYIIPVAEFSFFKKRINLNCAYSMPISRRAMGMVHFLNGAITLIVAFTASYAVNFILMLTRGEGHYRFAPMIPHYLLCVLLGLAMYSFMTFVFNEANSRGDGIWSMLLWTFAPILLCGGLQVLTDVYVGGSISAIHWGNISDLTAAYIPMIELDSSSEYTFWDNAKSTVWFALWLIIGIAAAIGFFLTFGKRRMEKIEEISDSFFGYRVMIPLYAICGNIVFDDPIFWIIIEILALVGYTIYRKGFRYKLSDIIILASLFLFLFIYI